MRAAVSNHPCTAARLLAAKPPIEACTGQWPAAGMHRRAPTSAHLATPPAPPGQPPRLRQAFSGGLKALHPAAKTVAACLPNPTHECQLYESSVLLLIFGPPRTIWASSAATGASPPASTTAAQPAGLFCVRFISTASRARRQSCRKSQQVMIGATHSAAAAAAAAPAAAAAEGSFRTNITHTWPPLLCTFFIPVISAWRESSPSCCTSQLTRPAQRLG